MVTFFGVFYEYFLALRDMTWHGFIPKLLRISEKVDGFWKTSRISLKLPKLHELSACYTRFFVKQIEEKTPTGQSI